MQHFSKQSKQLLIKDASPFSQNHYQVWETLHVGSAYKNEMKMLKMFELQSQMATSVTSFGQTGKLNKN